MNVPTDVNSTVPDAPVEQFNRKGDVKMVPVVIEFEPHEVDPLKVKSLILKVPPAALAPQA